MADGRRIYPENPLEALATKPSGYSLMITQMRMKMVNGHLMPPQQVLLILETIHTQQQVVSLTKEQITQDGDGYIVREPVRETMLQ